MTSHLHRRFLPDMQISCPSKALGCTKWSCYGKSMGLYSAVNNFHKMESRLGDSCNMQPKRVLKAFQAHYSEGFCSETIREAIMPPSPSILKEENLFRRGLICQMDGAAPFYFDQPGKLKSHSSCQEAALYDPPVIHGSGLIRNGQCSTTETDESMEASIACRTRLTVKTGITADFGRMTRMNDASLFNIPQKPPVPVGLLSLGVCGNALIMRVGSNARCFHQQGLARGRNFGDHTRCCDLLYAPADAKTYGHSLTGIGGDSSKVMAQEPISLLQGATITTKNCVVKLRVKNKQKKIGKTATLTRDLFERSSFHLFEFLFCYPFMTPNAVASNFQLPSQESLRELASIINHAAVGSASVGVTLLLFVASRMLCINAALDKHRIASLAIGAGFLSLSLAIKRVSDVVMCMADAYSRSRSFKKEYVISLQKELQSVAFNTLPLIVMGIMGAAG